VTSSRMPFALDVIRKLGERGHEVFACDSYAASPGSHSRYLAGHFTTASAAEDPEQFASDVERIAGVNEIELVIPMFEEVFYLAAQRERLAKVTRLYAPPFRTLAQVHDKAASRSSATGSRSGRRIPRWPTAPPNWRRRWRSTRATSLAPLSLVEGSGC
jgi:hypothetical protein